MIGYINYVYVYMYINGLVSIYKELVVAIFSSIFKVIFLVS